jgi:large subunit ribosomal protein L3
MARDDPLARRRPLSHVRPQLKDRTAVESYKAGQQLDVAAILKEGEAVDVAGLTVGKGFQGKRWMDRV